MCLEFVEVIAILIERDTIDEIVANHEFKLVWSADPRVFRRREVSIAEFQIDVCVFPDSGELLKDRGSGIKFVPNFLNVCLCGGHGFGSAEDEDIQTTVSACLAAGT